MRRGSIAVTGGGEPLIVVEESGAEDPGATPLATPRGLSVEQDSPLDPYHLSPWRDNRKHSLPTPACTSGPTASQVRRLSEQGELAAREAREAAFLATLSQASAQPGGRRHSVVTISRVPQSLFGRGRRESIAAFPALARRRDSLKKCPPATDTLGSSHNLQLDIMDDIVQARKVRMRLWTTSSERVCEVQPLDEAPAAAVRYTHRARRHSDLVRPPPVPPRRAPPPPPRPAGVVCSDTDLRRMLSALTSSAAELDRCALRPLHARSNSFDASALRDAPAPGAVWFARRHQTLESKKESEAKRTKASFAADARPAAGDASVVWDRAGSVVDASALGSAIEVFLRRSSASELPRPPAPRAPAPRAAAPRPPARWCAAPRADADDGCEPGLCSSLKDLFV